MKKNYLTPFEKEAIRLVAALKPFAEVLQHIDTASLKKNTTGDWRPAIDGRIFAEAREALASCPIAVKLAEKENR